MEKSSSRRRIKHKEEKILPRQQRKKEETSAKVKTGEDVQTDEERPSERGGKKILG